MIADLARQFVLVRLTNMRGVNLNVFDFDHDLTWMAFFLNADEHVYGRFGGRDADSADKYSSLKGLRHAMRAALDAHQRSLLAPQARVARKPFTVEQYQAARQRATASCIHCHHVHEMRRADRQAAGEWRREDEWIYPPPENLGFSVDPDQGDRVRCVAPDRAAARLGLRIGDHLRHVNGWPVASFADVQYALHRAPAQGQIEVIWRRGDHILQGKMTLPNHWRQADVSWRWSLRTLDPYPAVFGEDLSTQEKKELRLREDQLAFRQASFVPAAARRAGIQANDVIVGFNHRYPAMTARQFQAYVRLHFQVGDRVVLHIQRAGQRLDIPMTLERRPPI